MELMKAVSAASISIDTKPNKSINNLIHSNHKSTTNSDALPSTDKSSPSPCHNDPANDIHKRTLSLSHITTSTSCSSFTSSISITSRPPTLDKLETILCPQQQSTSHCHPHQSHESPPPDSCVLSSSDGATPSTPIIDNSPPTINTKNTSDPIPINKTTNGTGTGTGNGTETGSNVPTQSNLPLRQRNLSRSGGPMSYSYWNPKPKNKCIGSSEKAIYVILDDESAALYDRNEADKMKYSIFWELLKSYNLHHAQQYGHKLRAISPVPATTEDLLSYHDEDYLSVLEHIENFPEYSAQTEDEKESLREYGLMDDSPIFDGLHQYCLTVAGGSLQCADLLKSGSTRIAIHFGGGRHHAFSSRASGHCYVNDIILCIDSLRNDPLRRFNKVLYLDLDLHHCDAVEDAYYDSNDVFVASIHHRDTDFFPQTGDRAKCGGKEAMFHNLNVAVSGLKLRDDAFCDIVSKICHRTTYYFQPDAVVICAGADGLQSDPFQRWNLSINGLCKAVQTVLTQIDVPTVILGGGGYNPIDTAKCWTKMVSNAAGIAIPNEIPFHCNFSRFAPQYLLHQMSNDNELRNGGGTGAVKEEEDEKRKVTKAHIQSMQQIYGHLNNFERLFVANNLTMKRRVNQNAVRAMAKNRNNGKRRNYGRARREREEKQKSDSEDVGDDGKEEKEKENGDVVMDGLHGDGQNVGSMDLMDGMKAKYENDKMRERENGLRSKRPVGGTGTTNTCRSRRKKRRI